MTETQQLIGQLHSLSYLGIFGVSILSNVVVPVPEEIVLLALGYLAAGPSINGFILLPIVFFGLLISDMVMFFLSSNNNKLVTFFYNKFFAKRLESKKEWLEKHINKVIFFSRFMVQLRFLGPFLAGQNKIGWKRFLTFDVAALLIYVPLYLFIGFYFRSRVEFIADQVHTLRNIIIMVVVIGLLISLYKYIRKIILGEHKNDK